MKKVVSKSGLLFNVTLADGSNLCLQPGEEAIIKNELVSDSLIMAEKQGYVSIADIVETKSTSKTGGAK